jgi:hypothetical protein
MLRPSELDRGRASAAAMITYVEADGRPPEDVCCGYSNR